MDASTPFTLSVRETLGIITLIMSLVGNGFQWYRQFLYKRTIYNGLVAAFNSIGWILARCMNKTREVAERIDQGTGDNAGGANLREFREFSQETEFMLRVLHEQLVGSAKTIKAKDTRWQAGEFGYSREEIERFRQVFVKSQITTQ